MKLTSIYQVHFPAANWLFAHVEIRRAAKCYQPHNQFGKILWLCAPHTIVPFPKQEYLELQPKILIELEEGSIDTQRDFCFPSIFRPKPLQFFFVGKHQSFSTRQRNVEIADHRWSLGGNKLPRMANLHRAFHRRFFVGRGCFSSFPWAEWRYWRCSWWTAI